uniref:Ubiquitin-like protease family profile domain-containing protein n=1 Tax=Oryza meridionalis TaxID=40149 RepID=A0A0E0EPA1_9ORYZ
MDDKDVSYQLESEATEFVLNLLGINDEILYLDSLSFKNLNVPVEGYRATVWTNKLINQAILADTSADGSFGALPLMSSFQHEGTSLFGSNVDFSTFINSNVPNTMQQQEKDKIVIAVQNLCEEFSGLVTKFVRQISGLDFVDPRGSQPRKMRMNRKKLAQRPKRVQQDEDLDVTSSDDEDFVADEEEVEDTEEDEYTDEDGDSDDDEDEGEEDDDDKGEEDDDVDRSENDDDDGAETGRSGEQADAATDVTSCKGDDTNEGIGSGSKDVDDVTGCKGDDTNEGIGSGGKGVDDVIRKGKQVDEGIGFGDKEKHEENQAPNAVAQNVPELEKQPVQKVEKYPFLTTTIDSHEVPNFNLGFDSSQEVVQTPKGQEAARTSRGKEFTGIITNEDYGSFTIEDYEKVGREADEAIASKSATKSPVAEIISKEPIACEVEEETPVPHEYNKRVVKPAKFKSRKIIDTGQYYIYLGDLANSVKPMGSLDNNTCELALIVLSADIKDNSKRIFPARIGELGNGNDKAGHYFMVCLNLKAERFEVYDSLRGEDDEELISASHLVVASIKTMWDRFYMSQTYPCFVFANKNSRDCGFYMLKFVELWDGKQLPAFEPSDIPNIKKLLTHKMLSFQENHVQWMQVLWGKEPNPTL